MDWEKNHYGQNVKLLLTPKLCFLYSGLTELLPISYTDLYGG
jgi:hypothetical protein